MGAAMSTSDAERHSRWLTNNRFRLLENGEQFFPAVFAAIGNARREILIETFILFEDRVGCELQHQLILAAKRGVSVDLTIDGYGSPSLSPAFINGLTEAGVRVHVYDPQPRILGLRTNIFRRLHRKLVAIDGEFAFVGGINYAVDQLSNSGPTGKQDYSTWIHGSLVEVIRQFMKDEAARYTKRRQSERIKRRKNWELGQSNGEALFVTRDNHRHRDDIERHYRIAIRAAQHEVILCNAYFFPGYRLLQQLLHAARRGVKVKLILQGEPDMPAAQAWTEMLYAPLLQAGVEIHEYCRRPLHGKVAVIDHHWSTVGSSNLDPLSLALNLEANVIIRDQAFTRELHARLQRILDEDCVRVDPTSARRRSRFDILLHTLVYHCTRHFPSWAGWLPSHKPRLHSINAKICDESGGQG